MKPHKIHMIWRLSKYFRIPSSVWQGLSIIILYQISLLQRKTKNIIVEQFWFHAEILFVCSFQSRYKYEDDTEAELALYTNSFFINTE